MMIEWLLLAANFGGLSVPSSAPEDLVVKGVLQFEDGDRLMVDCGRSAPCAETIVRDARMQREINDLQGRRLTLRVRRVDACSAQSSEVVCLRADGSTALVIVDWLAVEPPLDGSRVR